MSIEHEFTAKGRYYQVLKDGDPQSNHTTEREAIERASNLASSFPDADIRYVHNYEVVVRVIGSLADQVNDTEAPTVPTGVQATAASKNRVDVSWNTSTDNVGVSGYQIFRDGSPLDTVAHPTTTYQDNTVVASTAYVYTVAAYDAANNTSAQSADANVTTPANQAPTWDAIPDQSLTVGESYSLNLANFSNDGDADTLTYSVVSGTLPTGVSLSGSTVQGTPTVADETPTVTFRVSDSLAQDDTTVNFSTSDSDVTAPDTPANLTVIPTSATEFTVSWDSVTDSGSGLAGYRLYRDSSLLVDQVGTSYVDTGVSTGEQYTYTISAYDNAGNESSQSAGVEGAYGYYVSAAGSDANDGSINSPWQTLSKANTQTLTQGQRLLLRRGDTFTGTLQPSGSGTASYNTRVEPYGSGNEPVVREAQIDGDYVTVDNIDFDNNGQNPTDGVVRVRGDNFVLQNASVHNSQIDGVNIEDGPTTVTVDNCEIYHLLAGSFGTDDDAHGISIRAGSGNTVDVDVIDTTIHEVSGDCIQADPDRLQQSDLNPENYASYSVTVNVTGGEWYTQPLVSNMMGWNAGQRPGEDGIDTKANAVQNGTINVNITDLTAYGWLTDSSPHANPTPFNLKENVNATLDRLTLYDNQIAFRIRHDAEGDPDVNIYNAVVYDCNQALRIENDAGNVTNLNVFNSTFGDGITTFLNGGAGIDTGTADLRNNVFLGTKPTEFSDATNVSAASNDFADSTTDDFRLADGGDNEVSLIDAGDDLSGIFTTDRAGTTRTVPWEIGAYDGFVVSSGYPYYDYLVAEPLGTTLLGSFPMDSLQNVIDNMEFPNAREALDYDAAKDAARWTFGPNEGSMSSGDQVRAGYWSESSGRVLYHWEGMWDSKWETNAGGINTHKSFQITNNESDQRSLEARTHFGQAPSGYVARIDIRDYDWGFADDGALGGIAPQDNVFDIAGDVWTRQWVLIDMVAKTLTMWAGDETRAPVRVYDQLSFSNTDSLRGFWAELNSSQSRSDPETIYIWMRRMAVLKGIASLSDAQSIVDEGSQV